MLGVVDVGWGLESEKTVLVEVEAVTIDIQVAVAPGGHEEIVFVRVGLVVKDAVRVVDLAEILVGAVFAGGVDLFGQPSKRSRAAWAASMSISIGTSESMSAGCL